MKKLSFLFLLLIVFTTCTFAQYPNWGWGPAITASQNGSTLTCTTFDPFLNATRTTSFSSVSVFQNQDGNLAYITTSGEVVGVIYDINQGMWKPYTFAVNSGTSIDNSGGVIAWQTSSHGAGAAVYDPAQELWETTSLGVNGIDFLDNQDGVVVTGSNAGALNGAVYDPSQHLWQLTSFSVNNADSYINVDGVVAWASSAGSVSGAVYDPAQNQWKSTNLTVNSGNFFANSNGVIAYNSNSGSVGAMAYDHVQNQWITGSLALSGGSNLSIADGTVFWVTSNGQKHGGYSFSSHSWLNDFSTQLHCRFFVENATGNAPLISYFWCLSVGADSHSYNSGAGHTITRRSGFKQYDNPGVYSPQLTIFNSTSNSNCDATVTVGGVGLAEETISQVSISPNPLQHGDRLEINAPKAISNVIVRNMMGLEIFATAGRGDHLTLDFDQLQLAAGIYIVEVAMDGKEVVRRKILVE